MKRNLETRNCQELRAVSDEGVFEGYIAVWNTTDSYNSRFQRGAFKKTIEERRNKIKVFYDHEHLVGSSMDIHEDDHGVFVRGKLNLNVEKAKECYEFMRDGTLDGLSFGFNSIQEGFDNGVRVIKEVRLYEYGPVVFPANDSAAITQVRAINFADSLESKELYRKLDVVWSALSTTIEDIWWDSNSTSENVVGLIDDALSAFHAAYLEAAQAFVAYFWAQKRGDDQDHEFRAVPTSSDLVVAFRTLGKSIDTLCGETSLTRSELEQLRKGQLIEKRFKLDELPEAVKTAHQEQRMAMVESLCRELRTGLSEVEKRRISALLASSPEGEARDSNMDALANFFQSIRPQD